MAVFIYLIQDSLFPNDLFYHQSSFSKVGINHKRYHQAGLIFQVTVPFINIIFFYFF